MENIKIKENSIKTESRFLLVLIWHALCAPFVLLLALFGKRKVNEAMQPFFDIVQFLFEARVTIWLILIISATSIAAFFATSESQFNSLLTYPQDIIDPSRYFSLISGGFIHAGWSHLFWNMLALFIFGRVVERSIGGLKMALIYFAALIFSGVIDCVISFFFFGSTTPSLGASGAIMGIVAAAVLLDPFYITYEFLIPLPLMVVGWITLYGDVSGILSPTEDGVGHLAHLLGFFSVTVSMKFLDLGERNKIKKGFIVNIAVIVLFLIGYAFFFLKTI